MDLFATLKRKQRFTDFDQSFENRFFLDNLGYLNRVPSLARFSRAEEPFDIIRANILIRALQNKEKLEKTFLAIAKGYRKSGLHEAAEIIESKMDEVRNELPCMGSGRDRIFVPILPKGVNSIYAMDMLKLEEKPYRFLLGNGVYEALLCDPFDTYGADLYDSYFTNLVCVGKSAKTYAFYSFDAYTIYFVDKEQGRLETELCLFDRGLKQRYTNHILERIAPVVECYFKDDKGGMMKALVDNRLISSKLIYNNISKERLLDLRFYKKAEN